MFDSLLHLFILNLTVKYSSIFYVILEIIIIHKIKNDTFAEETNDTCWLDETRADYKIDCATITICYFLFSIFLVER